MTDLPEMPAATTASHQRKPTRANDTVQRENAWRLPAPGSNTDGSTMLLVMTILSLAMTMAIGYSVIMNEQQSQTENSFAELRSRQLANSGLRQAIAVLKSAYDPRDGLNDTDDLFPASHPVSPFYSPATGPFAGRAYLCSTSDQDDGIAESLAVSMNTLAFLPNAALDVTDPTAPTDDDRGYLTVATDSRIVGRFAYMIIDESGKLDPSAVAEIYGIGNEATGSAVRDGTSDSDICLQDAGLINPDSYLLSPGNRWHSMSHVARQLMPPDFSQALAVLNPHTVHDEIYWNDDNNDGWYDDGEDYLRIDLSDPAAVTAEALYKRFVAADDPDTAMPDIGDTTDDNDCRWIKRLAADGIVTSNSERRRVAAQVAANMQDYVDADSDMTRLWVTITGELSATDPGVAYTDFQIVGRENQFGLSEVSIRITTTVTGTGPMNLETRVYVKGEVFFPAAENVPVSGHTLSLQYSMTGESNYSGAATFFSGATATVPLDTSANEYGGTLHYTGTWKLVGVHVETAFLDSGGSNDKYKITDFRIDAAELKKGATTLDSFPAEASSAYWWNWSSATNLTGAQTLFATLEALDPMHNESDESSPTMPYGALWRARPSGSASLYASDTLVGIGELTRLGMIPGTGPPAIAVYGDAVVTNTPFLRVGEIGRVDSYWPGRSLRLWAADAGAENGVDCDILDIFRIGNAVRKRGRVNANTRHNDVLTALFNNATSVPVADAVNAVLAARAATTFVTIGDLFRPAGLTGTDASLDVAEELMVERLAELVTTRRNCFTIVVTAQAIKDVGDFYVYVDLNGDGDTYDTGESILTQYGVYDPAADQILATTTLLAVVIRDPISNHTRVDHIEYVNP